MTNPFKFRPVDPPDDQTAPDEWADNWLSNFMAWFSLTFLDPWCSTPTHWTSRLTDYLFTSCPCCLLWRGLMLGVIAGIAVSQIFVLLL